MANRLRQVGFVQKVLNVDGERNRVAVTTRARMRTHQAEGATGR